MTSPTSFRTCRETCRTRHCEHRCAMASVRLQGRTELQVKSFSIDCELEYDVLQQTLFLFNIAVPSVPGQQVRCETITALPAAPFDEFRDATGANRFLRVDVAPGRFSIRYLAAVDVDTPATEPSADR